MALRIHLIRWTDGVGGSTRIHVVDLASWGWTLCGLKIPPRTSKVYRSQEELELAREYPSLCLLCRRAFGPGLRPVAGTRKRRKRRCDAGHRPAADQLQL